ncbi:MAG: hypothetical protein R3Y60_03290 [bacterium]
MATKKEKKVEKENLFLKIILIMNLVVFTFIGVMLLLIFLQLKNPSTSKSDELNDFDFQVDNINYVESNGKVWNDQIFAPFVDITGWVSGDYSVNGALNLSKIMNETNIQYFNLGFITALSSKTISNNKIDWGFGGFEVLSENQNNSQYEGIKQVINEVRGNGGDVAISIGGLNEGNFFQVTNDIDILTNSYLEIVDGFNLTRLDLDIEGGSLAPYVDHSYNAKAIKKLQDLTNVEVVLTLPVMPEGLISSGLSTLNAYVSEGVDIKAVNIMAMCYGESYYDRYDTGTITAIDNTKNQIIDSYKNIGITLSDKEGYNKVGVTTSIGYEGWGHPVFTTTMTKLVVDYAIEKQINFTSYWSMNRDCMVDSNSGIYSKYEHALINLKF